MKKLTILAIGAALSATAPAQADVIAGFNFTSSATSLEASSGAFTTEGGSLAAVLTDNSAGTWAFSFSPGASVTLGFSAGILNGPGADLVLLDAGVPADFVVTINGVTQAGTSIATGFSANGFGITALALDLSAFGVAAGGSATSALIGMDQGTPIPSLSYAGVLNTGLSSAVPEPSTWAMMLIGLAGLGSLSARRRRSMI
ncbi:MAG: PEP-CTERM sorting domain-containing protein [Methylobacteriaceae bacterium]|nr:PEP-CTERM sorting domain-containing protein [Methylobacteriaceae bacterium]